MLLPVRVFVWSCGIVKRVRLTVRFHDGQGAPHCDGFPLSGRALASFISGRFQPYRPCSYFLFLSFLSPCLYRDIFPPEFDCFRCIPSCDTAALWISSCEMINVMTNNIICSESSHPNSIGSPILPAGKPIDFHECHVRMCVVVIQPCL